MCSESPSRLKGIETGTVLGVYTKALVKGSESPSRLKGIETPDM